MKKQNSEMATVIAINERNIRAAVEDYMRHTFNTHVVGDVSEKFITRLARESAYAKSALRDIFRRVKGWNEELQAVVVNGNRTHNPDPQIISELVSTILGEQRYNGDIWEAANFFWNSEAKWALDALNRVAPNVYREGKKLSRVFNAFAKAIGVYDGTVGSQYQRNFAQLADELNGKKIDFKLFVSINPAHFITASNPKDDHRGSMLTSCHSFNNTDYSYSAGNAGYATDEVTFTTFCVDDPSNPELLNNRKVNRQHFMYRDGVLLQSRLYTPSGGVYHAEEIYKVYRDLVERVICEGEGTTNLWAAAQQYGGNSWGLDFPAHEDFGGYCDWEEFATRDKLIQVTVRKDVENPRGFVIGNCSICVVCGDDTYGSHNYCDNCDEDAMHCDECGCRLDEGGGYYWVFDQNGNEIVVCEGCLEEYYAYCEHCDQYHHVDNMTWIGDEYVCDNCREEDYARCSVCGEWHARDDMHIAVSDGEEVWVCDDCTDGFLWCDECGTLVPETEGELIETEGDEMFVCRHCLQRHNGATA